VTSKYFDDFSVGDKFTTPGKTISEGEILDFAFTYDPQPLHTDKTLAEQSDFAGLIASGFHTLSVSFSLFFRLRLLDEANMASPGMDEVRWLAPVRPGDTLHVVIEVKKLIPSKSRPDCGIVVMDHISYNQHGDPVMSVNCMHRLKRRGS
jgi:acyl dehydratase